MKKQISVFYQFQHLFHVFALLTALKIVICSHIRVIYDITEDHALDSNSQ